MAGLRELRPTEDTLGEIGHCYRCGGPVWKNETKGWLHAEDPEGPEHEVGPAGPDVDVDELAVIWVTTVAEVNAMTAFKVREAAQEAGLPVNGSPAQLKARYLEWRVEKAARARAADAR